MTIKPGGFPAEPPPPSPRRVAPIPVISPQLALQIGARVLDPTSAPLAPGRPTPAPTVYIADSLLISTRAPAGLADTFSKLRDHAKENGITATLTNLDRTKEDGRTVPGVTQRVELTRSGQGAAAPVDAWAYLQQAIADGAVEQRPVEGSERTVPSVSLEHVLTTGSGGLGAAGGIWGSVGGIWGSVGGIWGSVGGIWGSVGLAEYGSPGIGGRTPVKWCGRDPRRALSTSENPPVVAILDTGIGRHPWFRDGKGVHRRLTHSGQRIGLHHPPESDPELTGSILDPLNGLVDAYCGHGTFVAGIIRQRCPEAELLSIPVTISNGAAREGDVIAALEALLQRHLDGQADRLPDDPTAVLDFVNLSLGYYNETPPDAEDSQLHDVLRRLTEAGVSVVAAAGNDATLTEFFPAAFKTTISGLTSVGAQNTDGRTVALFSNAGDWVTTHAPGTAIVSTVPTTLSGSRGRTVAVEGFEPAVRGTVDADDYSSGFALWSGTSFASPYVVGEAASLVAEGRRKASEAGSLNPLNPPNPLDATSAVAKQLTDALKSA